MIYYFKFTLRVNLYMNVESKIAFSVQEEEA